MMDKARKKSIKRALSLGCVAVLVVALAVMPLAARSSDTDSGPEASILSGTAEVGTVQTSLKGGGILAETDAVEVSVPADVKLTGFLVENGDAVQAGDPLAGIDRVSVMNAITQVQETLEYLSGEIQTASEETANEKLTAPAEGVVKAVYVREGDSVQDVMLEYGALAVVSVDGLMAVDVETESGFETGTELLVTLADGSCVTGTVSANLAGTMTVNIQDQGYEVGQTVQVTTEHGMIIGSGSLYIRNPWNVTAYSGTVKRVRVSENDAVDAGDTLVELTVDGLSGNATELLRQRGEYEELMLELFKLYQEQVICAPCDGVVSGVDEDSVQLLCAGVETYRVQSLANAPNGDDETLYSNFLCQVRSVRDEGWELLLDPQPYGIGDYLQLGQLSLDGVEMTENVLFADTDIPVFALEEENWVLLDREEVGAGDMLLLAFDGESQPVWAVMLRQGDPDAEPTEPKPEETHPEETVPEPTPEETFPEETVPETLPEETHPEETVPETLPEETHPEETVPAVTEPAGTDKPTEPIPMESQPSAEPAVPEETGVPEEYPQSTEPAATEPVTVLTPESSGSLTGITDPSAGINWGSITGGMTSGAVTQEPEFTLYSLEEVQIAAVTAYDSVTLEISVDEGDIREVSLGMTAQVRVQALSGQSFEATVTALGNSGTSNGGSSKFTLELTMQRGENMLAGMNATAELILGAAEDVVTVPAAALVEEGARTVIYTGYDQDSGTLTDPVEVTTGTSDGETVEILAGLEAGDTYYYAYYDTLEVSNTPDFGISGFSF